MQAALTQYLWATSCKTYRWGLFHNRQLSECSESARNWRLSLYNSLTFVADITFTETCLSGQLCFPQMHLVHSMSAVLTQFLAFGLSGCVCHQNAQPCGAAFAHLILQFTALSWLSLSCQTALLRAHRPRKGQSTLLILPTHLVWRRRQHNIIFPGLSSLSLCKLGAYGCK